MPLAQSYLAISSLWFLDFLFLGFFFPASSSSSSFWGVGGY
jgi:hypothetical protein